MPKKTIHKSIVYGFDEMKKHFCISVFDFRLYNFQTFDFHQSNYNKTLYFKLTSCG